MKLKIKKNSLLIFIFFLLVFACKKDKIDFNNVKNTTLSKTEADLKLLSLCKEDNMTEIVSLFNKYKNLNINIKNEYGETPLLIATNNGNYKLVKFFIDKGADVNIQDDSGYTPLMLAVDGNRKNIVLILLENEANINLKDHDLGLTAIQYAVNRGYEDIVYILKSAGEIDKLDYEIMDSELIKYSFEGNLPMVKELIKKGANINAKNYVSVTPLIAATHEGNLEIVKFLIQYGADRTIKSFDGTALDIAKEKGFHKIVEILKR